VNINELHERARHGTRSAEEALFEGLTVSFRLFAQHRIGNREDAEEVVQEALVTISTKYRQVAIETSFAAWAYRILVNKILDHLKGKKARGQAMARFSESRREQRSVTSDPTFKRRLLDCLKKVNEANRRHARILNLHYQGYSTQEICERLGITQNHFYVTLSRARSMLQACLDRGEVS
jgi:RNA polymerase sigma-70 factor (ECF subfamily)